MTRIVGISGKTGRINRELHKLLEARRLKVKVPNTNDKVISLRQIFEEGIDVFIDFSHPCLWSEIIKLCCEFKVPLISGTTGIHQLESSLKFCSRYIPVCHSSNFSSGIYYIKHFLKLLKVKFDNIDLHEEHHINKIDAPSGTALDLCDILKINPRDVDVVRQGDHIGKHKVSLSFDNQKLEIEHCATSKAMFAQGALDLVPWILEQEHGVYTMDHYMSEVKLCHLDTL